MYHRYQEWIDNPARCTYLGSERNPSTGMEYDYWLVKTGVGRSGYSPTARHGMGAGDYGSGPLCVAHLDRTHYGADLRSDYVFGMVRAQQLAMYYLATGERPMIPSGPYEGIDFPSDEL